MAEFNRYKLNLQNIPIRTEQGRRIRDLFINRNRVMATFFNWERIERLAGPNERWPDRAVYLYCSTRNVTEDQIKTMRAETEARGWELVLFDGHYYLISPQED